MSKNGSGERELFAPRPKEADRAVATGEPVWDKTKGRWYVVKQISKYVVEYVEVPSPQNGQWRSPPDD